MRRPIRRAARRPFGRLVNHFLSRLVRDGQEQGGEFELGFGGLLGLLAAPGAINCFLLFDKYSSLLDYLRQRRPPDVYASSLGDKYLYITLAIAICGIVTVLKWDRILPDSQDYINLAPLPIGERAIFLANASAILIAVTVVAIDVNGMPAFLLPSIIAAYAHMSGAASMQFLAIHALCVGLASLFAIASVFAILGTLSAILPRAVFRACAWWVRGMMLIGFLAILFTSFSGGPLARRLEQYPDSALRWLPSIWYIGLYQSLQHRATPALASAAAVAVEAAAIAVAVMVITYVVSYRKRFAAVLESGPRPSTRFAFGWAALDLFAGRANGFRRGCHRFVVRALLRSEPHRLTIGVAIGLGLLLGLQTQKPLTEAPLLGAYLLILALRVAFDLPSAAAANWIFRAILDHKTNETAPVARGVMFAFVVPVVMVPSFAAAWYEWGIVSAVMHISFEIALCWVLIELILAQYRKLPLTCPMPGLRDNFLMLCLIQLFGLSAFTVLGSRLELWLFQMPLRFVGVPVAMAAAWWWNQRRIAEAREAGEWEEGFVFENTMPALERLNLSDGL